MFALRGVAASFSVFVILYFSFSLAVVLAWRHIHFWARNRPAHRLADLLFGLRLFPVLAAIAITAALIVPSFLLLEPRTIVEPVEAVPLALCLGGIALAIFGVSNALFALRRASRAIAVWTNAAEPLEPVAAVPVLRIGSAMPALTVAGVLHPRLLVSSSVESVLTKRELQVAMNHEVAHVAHCDNLKKLLLRFVAFPGMRNLESAWHEFAEMAADDAAVSNASDALDLAVALIKVARSGAAESRVDLTAALAYTAASSTNARVERLIAWADRNDETFVSRTELRFGYGFSAALLTLLVFTATYSRLLVDAHQATEWLMR